MRTKQKVARNRNQTHKMNEGGVLVVEKKTIEYYMALPYQEVIVAAKESGYVGYIPELKDVSRNRKQRRAYWICWRMPRLAG